MGKDLVHSKIPLSQGFNNRSDNLSGQNKGGLTIVGGLIIEIGLFSRNYMQHMFECMHSTGGS